MGEVVDLELERRRRRPCEFGVDGLVGLEEAVEEWLASTPSPEARAILYGHGASSDGHDRDFAG